MGGIYNVKCDGCVFWFRHAMLGPAVVLSQIQVTQYIYITHCCSTQNFYSTHNITSAPMGAWKRNFPPFFLGNYD